MLEVTHGMKPKTIKSALRRKTDAWLATVENEELRAAMRKDAIVTGRAIASMLTGDKVNDFDIYFRNMETAKRVATYYLTLFAEQRKKRGGVPVPMFIEQLDDVRGKPRVRVVVKSAGVEGEGQAADYHYFEHGGETAGAVYVQESFDALDELEGAAKELENEDDKPPYRPVFFSSNAISLSNGIQIILRFYGDPDEIHESYDFAHCTNHWSSGTGELVLRQEALEALLSRTLVYRGSLYPVCSMFRVRKFVERGWRINAGQILKMALQIAKLDLTDYATLEDQLTGVDVAYFEEVLAKIKAKQGDNETKVDSAYLIEILDRMF